MSLDVELVEERPTAIFGGNITHNLGAMASEAGIYAALWRPDEHGFATARHIVPVLESGLALLESEPDRFRQFDSPHGWGTYEQFVPWVRRYLDACRANPDARIRVSR